jgi:hypothetical protein
MEAPPAHLLEGLSRDEYREVIKWWNALSEDSRCEITGLWDNRLDSCAWTAEQDESGTFQFHPLPIILTNRFVPAFRETPTEVWQDDFFEYMFGRPDVYLWEPPLRTFYIGGSSQQSELILLPGLLLCLSGPHPPQ